VKPALAAVLAIMLAGPSCSESANMVPSVHDIKAKYEDELMAKRGVVSVGIGQDADGNPVIVVGLDRPRAETLDALPKDLDGYPVHAEVIGPIKAQ